MNGGDMGTRHEQKPTADCYFIYSTHLITILLQDKAPQTFIQKPKKEKTQARKPSIFLRAGMTAGAPRGRAGYHAALVVTRLALVRRPSVSVSVPPEASQNAPVA